MKERQIKFTRNDDKTIVIDSDGTMVKNLKKIYQNTNMNLGFCCEQLEKGKLTEGMKQTHLSLAESYMVDFLKEMNYDSILEKEKNERFIEIRTLNQENRELRKQLGEKVSNEDLREKLKNLSEQFKRWWNIEGFGHTSTLAFTSYGSMEIELSGMITDAYYAEPKLGKKEKIDNLLDFGFTISKEKEIISSDKNIELLKNLLKSKYPSSEIIELKTSYWGGENTYRDIKVLIRDLNDFAASS